MERDSAESVYKKLRKEKPDGCRFLVTFSVSTPTSLPWEEIRGGLLQSGFHRIVVAGKPVDIQELAERPEATQETCTVLVDRLTLKTRSKKRIHDSCEQAFQYGKGRLTLIFRRKTTKRNVSRLFSR